MSEDAGQRRDRRSAEISNRPNVLVRRSSARLEPDACVEGGHDDRSVGTDGNNGRVENARRGRAPLGIGAAHDQRLEPHAAAAAAECPAPSTSKLALAFATASSNVL